MFILDRSNCSSQAGWIDYDDGVIIQYNSLFAGKRGCEIQRVGTPSWNTGGNQRKRKQVGVSGMTLFLDYYFAGAAADYMMGFRRSTGLGHTTMSAIYNNGSGGLYMIENNTTPAPNAAPVNVGWINTKSVINADGTMSFYWISPEVTSWQLIGTTSANDWIGADMYFSTNCYTNGPNFGSFIDNLLWTKP